MAMTQEQLDKFYTDRKTACSTIDPATAEVEWWYAETLDPYGIENVPEENCCIGREYFARAPGSDIWVWFGDLPENTADELWRMHKHRIAFPAGLFVGSTPPF